MAWKRGEYIVNGLGHCAACHTPKDVLFGDITSKAFTGGVVDHWYAANLTGNAHAGLGKWSHDDLARFLTTGRNKYATAAGSMQEKVTLSTSHMTEEDRAAIATYLKSLPASRPPISCRAEARTDGPRRGDLRRPMRRLPPAAGRQTSRGPLPDYPKLAGDTLILGRDPTTVVRIILQGAESPVTPNEKTTYSMPAFATLTMSRSQPSPPISATAGATAPNPSRRVRSKHCAPNFSESPLAAAEVRARLLAAEVHQGGRRPRHFFRHLAAWARYISRASGDWI